MNRFINNIINEVTTSADIAFLPSGFVDVKKKLETLARLKKDWNIEILERDYGYEVNFEDKLKVIVEKGHFPVFCKNVLGCEKYVAPKMTVSLYKYLKEAIDKRIIDVYEELKEKLLSMLVEPSISYLDEDAFEWERVFGVKSYLTPPTVLIRLEKLEGDIEVLIGRIRGRYGNSVGEIEKIIDAIESKKNLSFEFAGRNLIGTKVQSEYKGVELIFTGEVSFNWKLSENIEIGDIALLDQISGELKGVKTSRNRIYPVGGRFALGFFRELTDLIAEVGI